MATEPAVEAYALPAVAALPAGGEPHLRPHHQILTSLQSMLYVLVVALFLMTFTVQPIRIPSASMEPTLLVGDFLLLDKASVSPRPGLLLPPAGIHRGDVIVFHDPIEDPSVHLVKRVIGLPGDRLHLRDGVVFLNGQPLRESYAVYRRNPASGLARDDFRDDFPALRTMDARVDPAWWVRLRGLVHDGDITVPPDSYFVLGDNRNDSEDSRYWGFVPRPAIVGKPVLIYFSWRNPEGDADQLPLGPIVRSSGIAAHLDFARWDRILRVIR
jgi:signal peptidase I